MAIKFIGLFSSFVILMLSQETLFSQEQEVEKSENANTDQLKSISTEGLQQDLQKEAVACEELYNTIKKSDCKLVKFLGSGVTVLLGLALNNTSISIENKKDESGATAVGDTSAAPLYSLLSKPHFVLDAVDVYYDYYFGYKEFFTVKQQMGDNLAKEELGGYTQTQMLYAGARINYALGYRDSTPDRFFHVGMGLGGGFVSVKGNVYITDKVRTTNPQCDAAMKELDKKEGEKIADPQTQTKKSTKDIIKEIKNTCELKEFDNAGTGGAFNILMGGRWGSFYSNLEGSWVFIGAEGYDYTPFVLTIVFGYVIEV